MSVYRPAPERPFIRTLSITRPRRDDALRRSLYLTAAGTFLMLVLAVTAAIAGVTAPAAPYAVLCVACLGLFLVSWRPSSSAALRRGALVLGVLVAATCFIPGCSSLDGAKLAANTSKDAIDAAQPIVHVRCTKPAEEALARVRAMSPGEERERAARAAKADLDERRCPEIWLAYQDLVAARVALIAIIAATEAGQCVGVSAAAEHCNVAGAIVDVVKASSTVAAAVKEHRP
jgi:hypothetical protein